MIFQNNFLKIGILGCRGIPNHYGGFEQFAERLSRGLADLGHSVWVYNSHSHPVRDADWHGVNRLFCHDPEYLIGQAGQFIYDLNCINDSRRRNFNIIYQLGYTSSSVWYRRLPEQSLIVTNMDGLEWQRSKYSPPVRRFLRYAEKLAVKRSHYLVADSPAIQQYLKQTYDVESRFISYGADLAVNRLPDFPEELGLTPQQYYLLIARIQPDNHIETIIRGWHQAEASFPLVVVGSTKNRFGSYLKKTYNNPQVMFLDEIFDREKLDQLRSHALLYFHGHSSGGTNPSLLEAMAAGCPICAHDNPFNRAVLGNDAAYFSSSGEITTMIKNPSTENEQGQMIINNLEKIKIHHNWPYIIHQYHEFFKEIAGKNLTKQ